MLRCYQYLPPSRLFIYQRRDYLNQTRQCTSPTDETRNVREMITTYPSALPFLPPQSNSFQQKLSHTSSSSTLHTLPNPLVCTTQLEMQVQKSQLFPLTRIGPSTHIQNSVQPKPRNTRSSFLISSSVLHTFIYGMRDRKTAGDANTELSIPPKYNLSSILPFHTLLQALSSICQQISTNVPLRFVGRY